MAPQLVSQLVGSIEPHLIPYSVFFFSNTVDIDADTLSIIDIMFIDNNKR